MPTAAPAPAKKAAAPRARKRPASPPPATFRQPVIPEAVKEEQKRYVNGLQVVAEHLIRLQPKAGPIKISKLELEDGSFVHSCRECDFTGTRGDCMAHRNKVHGARVGMKRKPKNEPLELLVPARPDGTVAESAAEMTMGEIMAILPSIKEFGDLIERTEAERDELAERCREYERQQRLNATKLQEYDELRGKVTELMIRDRQRGNYEEIKAELYELRAWKKLTLKRLEPLAAALGFKQDEKE